MGMGGRTRGGDEIGEVEAARGYTVALVREVRSMVGAEVSLRASEISISSAPFSLSFSHLPSTHTPAGLHVYEYIPVSLVEGAADKRPCSSPNRLRSV